MKSQLLGKWWPVRPDYSVARAKLDVFYRQNEQYYDMVGSSSPEQYPQLIPLLDLVTAGRTYAEIGSGCGQIAKAVAAKASVLGYDASPIAVARAQALCAGTNASFLVAQADKIPLSDSFADGAYSLEVFEHVWNPVAVLKEMFRIVKPGGFVFVTCPNRFSLDLHLKKRILPQSVETLCAFARYVQDCATGRSFVNLMPDIDGPDVYPDCDMVSSLIPQNLPSVVSRLGGTVELLDTFYMCSHKNGRAIDHTLWSYAKRPIIRWFGDHVLLVARKNSEIA